MRVVVLENVETLFPRMDKSHMEVASEIFLHRLDQYPQFATKGYFWSYDVRENYDGTARLIITVTKSQHVSKELILWSGIILFIFLTLLLIP